MRRAHAWFAAASATAVLVFAAALGGAAKDQPETKPVAPPPLKVDRGAPLLLEGPAGKESAKESEDEPAGPVADNSACHVCHANFQEESMAVLHAKADVGCVKCHGASVAHRNDEANVTPPDIMYSAAKIDAACRKCHDTHDAAAAKVIARWQERCPGKRDPKQVRCTDCHGEHRLKVRTVRWDKDTGKLLGGRPQGWLTAPGGKDKKAAAPSPAAKAN